MVLFDMPTWLTGFNFLMALFTLLTLVGGVIVVLVLRGRTEVSTIQLDRAVAAEALVKTRDAEIIGLTKTIEQLTQQIVGLEDELESVTAEHRTLAGISIAKLMEFWSEKDSIEAQIRDLHREIRILNLRKDGETK